MGKKKDLAIGDYVVIDEGRIKRIAKVDTLGLTNDISKSTVRQVPSITYELVQIEGGGFMFFPTKYFICEYTYKDYVTGIVHHKWAYGNRTFVLTEEDEEHLEIYLSGDAERYPIIMYNKLFLEAVKSHLKTGTFPEPNRNFL
jgi:hypothetical protein